MSDTPEVAEAKLKLRELVVPAVETLGELINSEHGGIRLGASKEVLDRGGLPARHDTHHQIDLTMDEEIEELLRSVRRQVEKKNEPAFVDVEDAVIIDEETGQVQLPLGESVAVIRSTPAPPAPEPEDETDDAWWQATPVQNELTPV